MLSRRGRDWVLIVAATVAGGWVADAVGLPGGYLFAALLVGLAVALRAPGRVTMPPSGFKVGQAITGVALGTFLHASTLTGLGTRWIAVILVSLATLVVTIVAGIVLARVSRLDRPTASLGMVAGGASGIVAMAGDLGADDRLVAFMQYLRVLVIALVTPLLVPVLFNAHSAGGPESGPLLGTVEGWLLTLAAGAAGAAIARRLRFPAPAFFGPLVLTSVLSLAGALGDTQVPALLREIGFALIGLQIGLGFDRATLREIARIAWQVAAAIVVLLVACFVLGWLLKLTAGVSLLDGYLATTPGGLFAVLPIAYGSGANTTFVLAVQGLRLLGMIVAAPAVVRLLMRSGARPVPG
ncbi:MAG TPA: AbrB family transcriptional regulator [Solirubrobacteraceae bacterium]|nr:AbrB family transcriptional regulator [Solirubrobacteraceae bacterium]